MNEASVVEVELRSEELLWRLVFARDAQARVFTPEDARWLDATVAVEAGPAGGVQARLAVDVDGASLHRFLTELTDCLKDGSGTATLGGSDDDYSLTVWAAGRDHTGEAGWLASGHAGWEASASVRFRDRPVTAGELRALARTLRRALSLLAPPDGTRSR